MARTECLLFLLFVACSVSLSSSVVSANGLSLVIGQSTTLQLSPVLPVEKSPGSKPSSVVLCERVQIHGLSRLRNLTKFAHSVKVKVSFINSSARLPNVEICFHRNRSLGVCMCPQRQWEKLVKGSWVRSMSPFDHKLLDVRMAGSSLEILQLSVEEELFSYRIIFLVLGIIVMTLASSLSKSLVFYYSSAMAVGIILVILMVLFQGMKLLPTGRKNSVAIFVYSSMLAIFLLLFLVIAGAWLGFWVVRKLVLTEDGLIDIGVSHFVAWSIRMIAAVMILQSSVDPLLAAEALLCGMLVSSMLKRITRSRFIRHWYKNLRKTDKSKRRFQIPDSSTLGDSYDEYLHNIQTPVTYEFPKFQPRPFRMFACNSPVQGLTRTPPSQMSVSETYYSSFHTTPERRDFTRDEWEKFTKVSTKKALEELVSSPDFSKWAVAHADRITLTPSKDATAGQRRRWFLWF